VKRLWPDIPNCTRYPIEEYINQFGRYATSTVAWMIGLAIIEGFERIELWGIEMASDTEYSYQKACTEYMIGQALGRGLEIYIPPQSALMQGTLYGYQDMNVGFRMQIEIRIKVLEDRKKSAETEYLTINGAYGVIHTTNSEGELAGQLEEKVAEWYDKAQEAASAVNYVNGQLVEMKNTLTLYDRYPFELDQSDGTWEVMDEQKAQA
jgi:hypothetical protein